MAGQMALRAMQMCVGSCSLGQHGAAASSGAHNWTTGGNAACVLGTGFSPGMRRSFHRFVVHRRMVARLCRSRVGCAR
jgi:hypothetical protein